MEKYWQNTTHETVSKVMTFFVGQLYQILEKTLCEAVEGKISFFVKAAEMPMSRGSVFVEKLPFTANLTD